MILQNKNKFSKKNSFFNGHTVTFLLYDPSGKIALLQVFLLECAMTQVVTRRPVSA
jgi:hypothetical protein